MDQMTGKKAMDPQWKFVNEDKTEMALEDYPINRVLKSMSKLEYYLVGVIRPDREHITWVSCNGLPLLNDSGELDHCLISFTDITDQKKAEEICNSSNQQLKASEQQLRAANQQLKASEQQLRTSNEELNNTNQRLEKAERNSRAWLENSPVCTKIVDLDFNLQYMSSSGLNALGFDNLEQIQGKPYPFDFYPESFKNTMRGNLEKAKETGEIIEQEAPVVDLDGSELWFHSTIVPVTDADDKIEYIIVVSLDITMRKQAEKSEQKLQIQLTRAERMKSLGVLAGGVAHDLNNVLGPMVVLPEIIAEDLQNALTGNIERQEEIKKSLNVIKSSAERAAVVVRDLVALSRRGQYDRVPTNINALPCITSPVNAKTLRKSHPEISITCNIAENKLTVLAGEDHLCRVINNLMRNAAEAIEGKGEVILTTSRKTLEKNIKGYCLIPAGEYAVIEISDTGHGIAPEDMDRIFEPFYTKKDKTDHSGSGLGLSVVHGVIGDHNGYIDVATEVGQGTTFTIYLPLIADTITPLENQEDTPLQSGKERVLIVDDESSLRFTLKLFLHKLGYTVDEAIHGHEALDIIKKTLSQPDTKYDLIILDMLMETGFDGLDTYEAILKLYPDQKVIVVSGYANDARAEAAQKLGANWLGKPFARDDLAKAVRNCLDA
jgi:PAS domain S-box-containing protein